ncbi:hypothetical protein GCM10018965_019040 [Nonomuraea roseola]
MAFGVWGSVADVATALGPVLGGVITSGINWRGIFLVNLPIGIAAIVITLRLVEESRPPHASRIDWLGVVTLTAGLFSLVYALIRASDMGWGEQGVLVCTGLAVLFLAAFVVVESRVPEPMFDLSLLRTPTFVGGSIAAFAMNASLFAMFIYLVLYLQNGLGHSAMGTGARLLVSSGCTLVAAMAAGRLLNRVPTRWLIGPGLVVVGIGLLLMRGVTADSDWTHLIPGFIVTGIGAGMVNPPLASTATGVAPGVPGRHGLRCEPDLPAGRHRPVLLGLHRITARGATGAAREHPRPPRTGQPDRGRHPQGRPGQAVAAAPPELRSQVNNAVQSA